MKSRGIRSEPEKLRNISGDLGAPHLRPRWKEGYKAILYDGYAGSYEMPGWLLTTDPMPTGDRWGKGPNEGRQTSKVIIYRGREVVIEATAGWIALILDGGNTLLASSSPRTWAAQHLWQQPRGPNDQCLVFRAIYLFSGRRTTFAPTTLPYTSEQFWAPGRRPVCTDIPQQGKGESVSPPSFSCRNPDGSPAHTHTSFLFPHSSAVLRCVQHR